MKPTAARQAGPSVQSIPLARLKPSPTNPRKTFDDNHLKELASSIKTQGIQTPLLVRPQGKADFDIVSGECRWRAAKLAGLKEVPAIVRDLTDVQVLEIQLVTNIQQGIAPLEEAEAFKLLLKQPNSTIDSVAKSTGKSAGYVTARLKLLALIPEIKKLLSEKKIPVASALLLSRLQVEDQNHILKNQDFMLPSPGRLREFIENNVFLDLSKARWDLDDDKLVPEAGSCTACPKRTGANKLLFADIKQGEVCTDGHCFQKKQQALVQIIVAKVADKEEAKPVLVYDRYIHSTQAQKGVLLENDYTELARKDECEHAEKAVVAIGPEAGKVLHICRSKECKKHSGRSGAHTGESPAEKNKRLEADRAVRLQRDVRHTVFRSVVTSVVTLERPEHEQIAHAFINRAMNDTCRKVVRLLGWPEPEKLKGEHPRFDDHLRKQVGKLENRELSQLLVGFSLVGIADDAPAEYDGSGKPKKLADPLLKLAESYKLDPAKIDAEVREAKQKKVKAPNAEKPKKAKAKAAKA